MAPIKKEIKELEFFKSLPESSNSKIPRFACIYCDWETVKNGPRMKHHINQKCKGNPAHVKRESKDSVVPVIPEIKTELNIKAEGPNIKAEDGKIKTEVKKERLQIKNEPLEIKNEPLQIKNEPLDVKKELIKDEENTIKKENLATMKIEVKKEEQNEEDEEDAEELSEDEVMETDSSHLSDSGDDLSEVGMQIDHEQPNEEQRKVFYDIMSVVINNDNDEQRLFFINGAAGTGKTFLLKSILKEFNQRGTQFQAMAYTRECARQLEHGASSIHSAFIIKPNDGTFKVLKNKRSSSALKKAEAIVIDLLNFCNRDIFEEIDETLQYLMHNNELFGGKIVIVAGDVNGLHPYNGVSAITSPLIEEFKKITLTQNVRFQGDPQFFDYLKDFEVDSNRISLPNSCIVNSLSELVDCTFGRKINLTELKQRDDRKILVVNRSNFGAVVKECVGRLSCDENIFVNTIGTMQSQTYDRLGIYAPKGISSSRALYTAMSRVKRQSNLKIFGKFDVKPLKTERN